MANRFYELKFKRTQEPINLEDFGNTLQISGLLFTGMGESILLVLPDTEVNYPPETYFPSPELWFEILRRSDDPVFFLDNDAAKIAHRKARYTMSGLVQQKVWVRDGLKCMYCNRPIGEVHLSVDHFIPLEMGGKNDDSNYLSACKKCNKDKGNTDPKLWCQRRGLNYDAYVEYLEGFK